MLPLLRLYAFLTCILDMRIRGPGLFVWFGRCTPYVCYRHAAQDRTRGLVMVSVNLDINSRAGWRWFHSLTWQGRQLNAPEMVHLLFTLVRLLQSKLTYWFHGSHNIFPFHVVVIAGTMEQRSGCPYTHAWPRFGRQGMSACKYDVIRVEMDWYFRRRQSYTDCRWVVLKIFSGGPNKFADWRSGFYDSEWVCHRLCGVWGSRRTTQQSVLM